MPWLKSLWRSWFGRTRAEGELADEVRAHVEMQTEENIRRGMPPSEARRQALLTLGGVEQVKEEVRAARPGVFLETLWQDIRYGARMLRKNPGFTLIAVLTLALGIGANTAIFSVVKPILFEPLPYPHPRQIVMIWDFGREGAHLDVTFGTYRELAERSRLFESMAAMKLWQPTLTGPAEPERLDGQRVSASYFRVLGVSPVLGRDFQAADDVVRGPNVVILSDGLWRRRFGGDAAIIGSQVKLNDAGYIVIGVMPRGFENVLAPTAEIWAPLQYNASLPLDGREWGHHLRLVARMRHDVGIGQAQGELNGIARAPLPEFPRASWAALGQGFIVNSLHDEVTRAVKPALFAVLGAVFLVLLIVCVNVANLLLARGTQRSGEFAVRAALGAERARMIRQLLTESVLLSAVGGALGILVAENGVRALVALSPPELPRVAAIGVNGTVFAFALGLATVIGLGVGLIPALYVSRSSLQARLQESSRRAVGGQAWARGALVVTEIALALVLLVGAGLLLRSMQRLFAVDPGFDASHVITMQVQTSSRRFADQAATHRFFQQALEEVRRVPGVRAAAFTTQLPLSGDYAKYGAQLESSPDIASGQDESALGCAVSPGYFEAMRIPLRRGRLLDSHDIAGAPVAVLVSESFARRRLPGQDPLGQRLHLGRTDLPWYTVVGVVGDVRHTTLAMSVEDAVYIMPEQWYSSEPVRSLVVRAEGDAAALAPAIRKAIWSVDKDQPVVRVATMGHLLDASEAKRRFALVVFEIFALVALGLAVIGVYGVVSYGVTQRTREIGIRMALGGQRGDIAKLVIGNGMALALCGIAIGLLASGALARLLQSLLFGIQPHDPLTFAVVALLLATATLLACYIPARRATRVDPMVALRYE